MKPEDLQDIILLCPSRPSNKTFELVNMFPKVHFMVVCLIIYYLFLLLQRTKRKPVIDHWKIG